MDKKPTAELIACPLCKGEARLLQDGPVSMNGEYPYCIKCRECGLETRSYSDTTLLRRDWNNRPEADRLAELEAALEAAKYTAAKTAFKARNQLNYLKDNPGYFNHETSLEEFEAWLSKHQKIVDEMGKKEDVKHWENYDAY